VGEAVVGTGTPESCTEQALQSAVAAGGTVTFDCGEAPVTILIEQGVHITKPTLLDGNATVTLDGGGTSRILIVDSGAELSARMLRFVRGKTAESQEADGIGGAISGQWRSRVEVRDCDFEENTAARGGGAVAVWTGSSLTVVSSRFRKNHSWYGGALYSLLSELHVVNSEFVANENLSDLVDDGAVGSGGAIGTDGASESPDDEVGGKVELCGSSFIDNIAYGNGGAAFIWVYPPDEVVLDRVLVAGNEARKDESDSSGAGGMRIDNGTITIRQSTFSGNTTFGNGGGLMLSCAPSCLIENSTLAGNRTEEANGGAFFFLSEGGTIASTTIADNFAGGHGGGIFGGKPELHNTVFVDNDTGNPWGQARNCFETSEGHAVLQWRTESSDAGGDACLPEADLLVADPRLTELGDHGGPTPTQQPQQGGGALGVGSDCPAYDQRGEPRAKDACDLGAVEVP